MLKRKQLISLSVCILLILCIAFLICWKMDLFKNVVEISGYPQHFSYEELVQKSGLIVRGKIVKKSKPIVIVPTNGGDDGIFTDHYLEISHVLRGDAQVGDLVAIRTEGGETLTTIAISDMEPPMERGDEVVAFLYRHNIGGGYTTKEDYYLILGTDQGLYYLKETESRDPVFQNKLGDQFEWAEFSERLPAYSNRFPIDETWLRKWAEESLEAERKANNLTQEEYQFNKNMLDEYATVR